MCFRMHRHDHEQAGLEVDGVEREDVQRGRERAFVAHAQRSGTVALLCVAIWMATGFGYFWPGWVLLFLALRLGIFASRVYGRGDRSRVDAYL